MQEQYTIRVYDISLINKIESLYKKSRDIHSTKNPFFVDCIKRGMEDFEREYFGVKQIKTLTEVYNEIQKTLEKLDKLIKQFEAAENKQKTDIEVLLKLLSCNYNMLIGISTDCPKQVKYVEAGEYDELPKRLKELIDLLKDKEKDK